MAKKPFNYPSPCIKCKKPHCTQKQCDDWLAYYYTHQKWINAWAKMHGVPVGEKKVVADGQD